MATTGDLQDRSAGERLSASQNHDVNGQQKGPRLHGNLPKNDTPELGGIAKWANEWAHAWASNEWASDEWAPADRWGRNADRWEHDIIYRENNDILSVLLNGSHKKSEGVAWDPNTLDEQSPDKSMDKTSIDNCISSMKRLSLEERSPTRARRASFHEMEGAHSRAPARRFTMGDGGSPVWGELYDTIWNYGPLGESDGQDVNALDNNNLLMSLKHDGMLERKNPWVFPAEPQSPMRRTSMPVHAGVRHPPLGATPYIARRAGEMPIDATMHNMQYAHECKPRNGYRRRANSMGHNTHIRSRYDYAQKCSSCNRYSHKDDQPAYKVCCERWHGEEHVPMALSFRKPWFQYPLYVAEFKNGRIDFFFVAPETEDKINVGDLVIVEADRGMDLGKIISADIRTEDDIKVYQEAYETPHGIAYDPETGSPVHTKKIDALPPGRMEIHPKRIYRLASSSEVTQLSTKERDEEVSVQICKSKVRQKNLPMVIVDAEYQWDRKKLTFYFVSRSRIDFCGLVRDLFKLYKMRIWMCSLVVDPKHKY